MIIKLLDDLFSHEPDFLKIISKIVISHESIKEVRCSYIQTPVFIILII
jgi:hypothetical protein